MKLLIRATCLTMLALSLASNRARACGGNTTTIAAVPTLGGSGLQLNSLNSAGQLTGYSYTSGNAAQHAILFSNGALTDLGSLGGFSSVGLAINSSGQIVGESGTLDFFQIHALLYSGGPLTDLGTLGGSFSVATAINDAGQVTGYSLMEGDASLAAFFYDGSTMTNLGTLGGDYSSAVAINQLGVVAGDSTTDIFENHAFLTLGGTMVDAGTLGGDYSSATALNDANTLVGESSLANGDIHAFAYAGGVMLDLATLGGTDSTASGINPSGQIIGTSTTPNNAQTHAFLYANAVMTDLGTLGGNSSEPAAINNLGEVVGTSMTASAGPHAFIYRNGAMTDLNTLLPANSRWVLSAARLINDSDRIVGQGTFNGSAAWFVMDLGAGDNHPPVAQAGSDLTVDCQSAVSLSGSESSDPDGDAVSFEWSENNIVLGTNSTFSGFLGLGPHVITLTVSDPCGLTAQDEVVVTVVDTTAPALTCPTNLTIAVVTDCQAVVPNLLSQVLASDNCASAGSLILIQNPPAGTAIGLGQHTVSVTATDPSGNSSTCSSMLNVVDSTPPVITSAPGSLTVSVAENCQGAVPNVSGNVSASDNCTTSGALLITQSPSAGSAVGLGSHSIAVTVTDASGNSATTNVTLNVVDSTPPVITSAPGSLTVSVAENCQGAVPNVAGNVSASDNCTTSGALLITQSPSAGSAVGLGPHSIAVTVTDASGNSATTNVTLNVVDSTPPVISSVSASPAILSPPNHQIVPVAVSVVAMDNCDSSPTSRITSVTCSEPTAPGDIQITGDLTLNLAASKNNSGDARVYTITVRCTDAAGNGTNGTVEVTVLKSNANSRKP